MSSSTREVGMDTGRLVAYALILLGVAWLLAATGFVPARFIYAGRVLWPLLAVGLGLDLLGARRIPSGLPYSLLALLVIAAAGFFFPDSAALRATLREATPAVVSEPIGSANRADVTVDAAAASLLIRAGAPEGVLAEATTLGVGRLDLTATGRSVRRLDIETRGTRGFARGRAGRTADTEIRLTDRIPVELQVLGREHATNLDLTGLDLAGFRYLGAAGPARITLGGVGPERYDAEVTGGSGPIDLGIPPGARLNLRLEPGAGGAAVEVGARSDLTLSLRGGDGPVALALPEESRVRVVVEDPGQGILSLSDRLQLVRGAAEGEEEDVYETAGYRDLIPTIDIRIEEAGAGPIAIR